MRGILLTATALACAPAVVSAGPFDLPADTVGLIGDACVTTSLDWPVLFTYAQELATARNLPQVMANDEAAMFGNPAGAHVMFARTIDSLACRIMIPEDVGTEAFYQDLITGMDWKIKAVYPDARSSEQNKPSPHEAAHQWVFNVPAERHFAVSLDWAREDGVSINVGYSQIYE
ncbi:MAG: hypothetical protein AAFY35_02485 [Pseudomonadota bacterium]